MSWKRLLLLAALASLSLTAALAILILLFGDLGETEGRILATTLAISAYSLLSLPGAILLERRLAVPLGWATVALAVAGFCFVLALIWGAGDGSEVVPKLAGTLTAFAAASTQIAALISRRRDGEGAAVRRIFAAAVVLALVLATLVTIAIWAEIDSETFFRVLGALVVLNVFLVALQPLLRRLAGPPAGAVRVTLEGTPAEIDDALRRLEGSGVRVRR